MAKSKGKDLATSSSGKKPSKEKTSKQPPTKTITKTKKSTPSVSKKSDPDYSVAKQFTFGLALSPVWKQFKNRKVVCERNYSLEDILKNSDFKDIFRGHEDFFSSKRLTNLLSPTQAGYPTLTKLWYAGIHSVTEGETMMICVKIGDFTLENLTPDTINRALGIVTDDIPLADDCLELPTEITKEEVQEAIYYCYNSETKSIPNSFCTKHLLKIQFLTFLYEVIHSNIVPQSGNKNNPTRFLEDVLYLIFTKNINIGQLILNHMFTIQKTEKLVLAYPCLILRILLANGYILPESKDLGDPPCDLQKYGVNAFDKMMNAGRDGRDKGIATFLNPPLTDASEPNTTTTTLATTSTHANTSTSSNPPPSITPTPPNPQIPSPSMDRVSALITNLLAGMEARLEAKLDGISSRLNEVENLVQHNKQEVQAMRVLNTNTLNKIENCHRRSHETQLEMKTSMKEIDQGLRYVWEHHYQNHLCDKTPYDEICGRDVSEDENEEDLVPNAESDDVDANEEEGHEDDDDDEEHDDDDVDVNVEEVQETSVGNDGKAQEDVAVDTESEHDDEEHERDIANVFRVYSKAVAAENARIEASKEQGNTSMEVDQVEAITQVAENKEKEVTNDDAEPEKMIAE